MYTKKRKTNKTKQTDKKKQARDLETTFLKQIHHKGHLQSKYKKRKPSKNKKETH